MLLDLYAIVTGLDADPSNDLIQSGSGSFLSSTGGLPGNLLGLAPPAPFNSTGWQLGAQADLDADGDLDVGATDPSLLAGFYAFRSGSLPLSQPPGGFFIGQVSYTATAISERTTSINWLTRANTFGMGGRVDGTTPIQNTPTRATVTSAAPVVIRGTPLNVQYLSGTIDTHVSATATLLAADGSTVTLTRGADVSAGAAMDLRDGGLFGGDALRVNDLTSGNTGGTLIVSTLAVGTSDAGRFVQSGGSSNSRDAVIGAGAGGAGASEVHVAGGTFSSAALVVGGASAGRLVQSGGVVTTTELRVATVAGVSGSSYEHGGGTLSGMTTMRVGVAGEGSFRQAGGNVAYTDRILVGDGGVGTMELNAGEARARQVIIGNAGTGHFIMSGGWLATQGSATVAPGIYVTPATPHTGTGPAPSGTFTFRGGLLQNMDVTIGAGGNGTFVHESGRSDLFVVKAANPSGGTACVAVHEGFFSPGALKLGEVSSISPGASRGHAVQSGGFVESANLEIGQGSSYTMTGGEARLGGWVSGTIDLSHADVTLTAWGWLTISDESVVGKGQIINAERATLRGEPRSLVRFPAGFDPRIAFAAIDTQGAIQIAGQPLAIAPNQSVGGNGTIAGDVNNAGTVGPGNSPGALTMTGNYAQSDEGLIEIEIAAATAGNFDKLTVTGTARLDGLLDVSLLNGFQPSASDKFTILTAANVIGRFDNVTPLGHVEFGGRRFEVVYTANSVTLQNFAPVPEPAAGVALLALGLTSGLRRRRRR